MPAPSPDAANTVRITPFSGSEIAVEKVPGAVTVVPASEQARSSSPGIIDELQRQVPGIVISDTLGNPLTADLQYRGFSASALNGTPQGLAVYQNGVRINEVFGDTVNWDLVPTVAIAGVSVASNNPAFGLNALGGAINLRMKDGFGFQGLESDTRLGSFGRRYGSIQGGKRDGGVAAYVAAEAFDEQGWRDRSQSNARRVFADLGAKGTGSEFHLSYTGADTFLGVTGPTPVDLLRERRANVFTTPQSFDNRMSMLNLSGQVSAGDTLTLSGLVYWRGFRQTRPDGNISPIAPCAAPENPAFLCATQNGAAQRVQDAGGNDIASNLLGGGLAGSNDRTSIDAHALGGSVQAVSKATLAGLANQFTIGASFDQGVAQARAASELGVLDPASLVVTGLGVTLGGDDFAQSAVRVRTIYQGLFVLDTLDVSDQLALTVGGRYNVARIELKDQIGTELNGSHAFARFNPLDGATFKLLPGLSLYGGYSEANRAPTPAELACANPLRPCLLESFLVSDPALKQVVAHTLEAGVRAQIAAGAGAKLEGSVGVFRTLNSDDIISVASAIQGRGYFLNAGRTLRQGVEAALSYRAQPWTIYGTYALVDATYRDPLDIASPHNPAADANGLIHVAAGDQIPTIPQHRFKAGFDYLLQPQWRIGADLVAVSSQFLRGDASNQNRPLAGYAVVNLHTSYDVAPGAQIYALVENALDARYATYGTFFDTGPLSAARGTTDPRTITPAPPLGVFGGLKLKF